MNIHNPLGTTKHCVARSSQRVDADAPLTFNFRQIPLALITTADIAAWSELEREALEPNAYLSPEFLLPASRHLAGYANAMACFLDVTHLGQTRLCAVVIVQKSAPSRSLLLPHLQAALCMHSFLGGVTVARTHSRASLSALLGHLLDLSGHGIVLPLCRTDGPTDVLLREIANEMGVTRYQFGTFQRAVLSPPSIDDHYISSRLQKHEKKARQQMRRLAAKSPVNFSLLRGAAAGEQAIERHLELEHMGWKGQHGTSLRSNPAHEAFFREVANGFCSSNRMFFAELSVGDRVIASSSNFISGSKGFAFKVGFDVEYGKYSPGVLNEFETIRHAKTALGDLIEIDSGTIPGSHIDGLWLDRHEIGTVVYSASLAGKLAIAAQAQLRAMKQRYARRDPHHEATSH